MSWASIANNQTVSFNNLQDAVNNGVFILKNTIPVPSTKQVTSGEAEYYVSIIPTGKPATQIVVKSNLVSLTTSTTTTIFNPPYAPVGTSTPFTTVAVSRTTGQYQVAGNSNFNSNPWLQGFVFVSDDYGVNWYKTALFGYWQKVATSDNGQYMLAVEYYGKAYRSSNYGATWTQITNFPYPATYNPGLSALQTLNFRGAALSDNGLFQVICTSEDFYGSAGFGPFDYYYNTIFVSSDYGVNWVANAYEENQDGVYNAVAISASGQIVLAAKGRTVFGMGSVVRSTNYGVNWSQVSPEVSGNLVDIAILADGSQAIAARYSNDYYPYLLASTNSGATWSNVTGGGIAAQEQWTDVVINTIGGVKGFAISSTNSVNKYIQQVLSLTSVSQLTSSGSKKWRSLANSNSGQYLLGATTVGLFKSSSSGTNWSQVP